jgi:uncharacterized protein YegL
MKWSDFENKQSARTTVRAVFVLDESGSMGGRRDQVISGFNESLQDMRSDPNPVEYLVTLIKFNTSSIVVYRDLPLGQVTPLSYTTYGPNGGTALLDAVGQAIDYYPANQNMVMVTIFTDGEENSSRQYIASRVHELINSRQNINRWGFVFMGANQHAWQSGSMLGVNVSNTVNFNNDFHAAYASASTARRAYTASACYASMTDTVNSMNNDNLFKSATSVEDLLKQQKDSTTTPAPVTP